jgi:hypothetical protein
MTIPETTAYTDLHGTVQVYDTSAVILPHYVHISFVADTSGKIIQDNWNGTYSDRFEPSRHPMPVTQATLANAVVANYPPSRHGGNWAEPTAEEAAQRAQQVTPDNILDKLKQK